MLELQQDENYIIGSQKAQKALAEKSTARILCISDSHGNTEVVIRIINQFGADCDAIAFCGDGAADIAGILTKAGKDDDFKNLLPPVLSFVQGNCDPSSFPVSTSAFKSIPALAADEPPTQLLIPPRQILCAAGTRIMLVHGNNQNVDWGFDKLAMETQFSQCQIALYGHTHIAKNRKVKDFTFINPGSCSRPRGGLPPSCAILTVTKDYSDTAFIKIGNNDDFSVFTPLS